jgi:TolB protein
VVARAAEDAAPSALVYERVDGGNRDIYVALPQGGERRLTDHPAEDALPRFTPDGRSVLFASERSGNWQIWEVPWRGGVARRVRENAATEWQVDLSPDGRRLAFLSNLEGPESLWLMEWPRGAARILVRHGSQPVLGNPHWSPDGRRIVFSSNFRLGHQIYIADAATGAVDRLSPIRRGGCEPRFHPDGRRVVYVSRGHLGSKSRLVEHDLETHDEKVLVDWPALNYSPVYAPDGSEIAFVSNISGTYQVYRQRLSDGRAWQVTFGKGESRNPDYRRSR